MVADSRPTPDDWGDPDPEEILDAREPEPSQRDRFVRGLRQLALLGIAAVVFAGLGGYLLGRSSPQVAATLLVRDVVVEEPIGSSTEGPAPSSGSNEFGVTATCGDLDEPLDVAAQRRAMYSGVVLVQVRDVALLDELRDWSSTQDAPLITTPNAAIDTPVVATAWARRMPLDGVNEQLLSAFVTAHGQSAPQLADC